MPHPGIIGLMLTRYIREAMKRARFKTLNDGTCFGEIPGLDGVWANEAAVETCREVLQEVLEEWLILKIRDNDPVPRIGRVGRNCSRFSGIWTSLPSTDHADGAGAGLLRWFGRDTSSDGTVLRSRLLVTYRISVSALAIKHGHRDPPIQIAEKPPSTAKSTPFT